jgi:LDH2 family malate/lactate/ureidoglycolate dehydrogenase
MVEVAHDRLRSLGARVFEAAGTPSDIARHVADHLVESNLAGHDSHGVIRIPSYVEQIKEGWVRPSARPRLVRSRKPAALVSGEWGFGHPAATMAMDEACSRAKEHGMGVAGLVQATHLGRLGTYVERAAGQGLVGLMWLGGLGTWRAAVPYGGREPVYGTNPIAAAFPAGRAGVALLDFATTAIAGGKIMVARDSGNPLPPGSVLDAEGRPSTDPADFFDGGALLPFGGHKGYALAFFAQLLGQSLTGAAHQDGEGGGGDAFQKSGSFYLALAPDLFNDAEEVVDDAAALVERVRSVPPAEGFASVMAPGDPEATARARRTETGIPLPQETWRSIAAVAARLGVDPG